MAAVTVCTQSVIPWVFSVTTGNISLSVNEIVPTSLDEYFQQLFRITELCMTAHSTERWSSVAIFEHKHFTR